MDATDRQWASTEAAAGSRWYAVSIPALLLVTAPYAIYLLPSRNVTRLTTENGPIEMAGALALLAAAVMFALAARSSSRSGDAGSRMTTLWLVGLVLYCSLAFMEEISWGQQLLHFGTPDVVKHYNLQRETNIHNLLWFNGIDEFGHEKSFWAKCFSSERLFNVSWFVYFVVMPVAAAVSPRSRSFFARWNLPLAPVSLSSVFVLNHLLYRVLDGLLGASAIHITEVSEFNVEALFAFAAAAMLLEFKQRAQFESTASVSYQSRTP